jgi:hypothetical protein
MRGMTEVSETMRRTQSGSRWQSGRSDALSPGAMLSYAVLAMGIVVVSSRRLLPPVLDGGLINPDSYMRLVRLEATVQAHAIVDVVARDGSGAGTLLYWSHLLDSFILLIATPLALVVDPHTALRWACAALGPLCIGGLGVAVAWTAAPFAERRWLWLGPVLAAVSPAIASYGLPGVAHHHVPLVVTAVAIAGWVARMLTGRSGPTAGWSLGAWAGAGIWLSPEAMPFVLMGFLALWLGWLADGRRTDLAAGIGNAGLAFFIVGCAAFTVDPPPGGYGTIKIDRLSVVYVGLALACCLAGMSVALTNHPRFAGAAGRAFAIGVAALGGVIWLGVFPAVLRGPDGVVDATDAALFFSGISEMQPARSLTAALTHLSGGAIAAAALGWFAWHQRSWLICYGALCAIGLIALGAVHLRFAAYVAAAAAILLPVIVSRIEPALARMSSTAPAIARIAVISAALLAPRAEGLPDLVGAAHAHEVAAANCSVRHLDTMLRPFAGQVVLANVNDTPELLYRTGILTVGSLYHHNLAGFLRLRAAWRSGPSSTEPDAVRRTGAAVVLFCPHPGRWSLIDDLPPDTLADQLARHAVPAWLAEAATDPASGNILYRVVK